MDIYYWVAIFILVLLCIYFWKDKGKKVESFQKRVTDAKRETLSRQEENEERVKELLERAKEEEATTIKQLNAYHNDIVERKNNEIENMKKYSLNRGEIISNQVLLEIKKHLIEQNLITSDEMLVEGNLFIPSMENNNHQLSQIDHIVLLPTNIFIIETKYWKGKVVHGLSKNNAGKLSFLLDELFPSVDKEKENVFLFSSKDTDNGQKEVNMFTYDNPVTQVRKTAMKLKSFLSDKDPKYNLVRTIVYYGYPNSRHNFVVDMSSQSGSKKMLDTEVITDKEELKRFFQEELENQKPRYTTEDLLDIKNAILEFNKLD